MVSSSGVVGEWCGGWWLVVGGWVVGELVVGGWCGEWWLVVWWCSGE